ncbi:DNA invertase-like protein [Salmonella enterica subsp. enterica]|nr:DNA invertase-like protein [Salmonella enterica subsp. enterica]
MLIGYVRVSTNDQNTDLQRNALNCAGCELIFEDKISGTKSERPGLKKLLRTLSAGDTLVVWKLDRLGAQYAASCRAGGGVARTRHQLS